jgi:hypothetical protein
VFELIDDVREKLQVTPKMVALSIAYIFLFGIVVGILIGELIGSGKWNWGATGQLFLMGVLLWKFTSPIFREIKIRLNNQNVS